MKYLILFVILFGYIEAMAKDCHLSYDQSQTLFVDCRIGPKPPEYKRVCRMVDGERDGSLYKVQIVEIPDGFLGNFLELIGLGNARPWSPGATVAKNERIVCTIDQDKVDAKEDARLAKEAEEKAKKDKKDSDWTTACRGAKVGSVEALICEERGY